MDVLANHSIFQELQLVHDTGYFSAMPSLEENWQQVSVSVARRRRRARLSHVVRIPRGALQMQVSTLFISSRSACVISGRNGHLSAFYHPHPQFARVEGMETACNKAVKCDLQR